MTTGSSKERSETIRAFIIENVGKNPSKIARVVAQHFGISRQTANHHLRRLVAEGALAATGKTKARQYELCDLECRIYNDIPVTEDLQEDREWREKIAPYMGDVSKNVVDICQYGFVEMVNNVIDHSESKAVSIFFQKTAAKILIMVSDSGVGIFQKIKQECNLDDERHAILELSKGKLTTDPESHTGEGIFFTSRMFDHFSIRSYGLLFGSVGTGEDWLIEEEEVIFEGTKIFMEIGTTAKQSDREIFAKYQDDFENYAFTRTHVPIRLARYEGEQLVSRSQARRLLARFDRFEEAILDFGGVETIGPAFADEIFRVFQNENPEMILIPINLSPEVTKMIARATDYRDEQFQLL